MSITELLLSRLKMQLFHELWEQKSGEVMAKKQPETLMLTYLGDALS